MKNIFNNLVQNPFRGRQPGSGQNQQSASSPSPAQGSHTTNVSNGNNAADIEEYKGGELNLVNYSPEQLVQQVNRSMSRVQFGWTWTTKFMENYSEIWAVAGPVILVIGTIGEVFLVLWLRQKAQEISAGLSIVAVALVLEGTFLAVSYKAATIRNRAEKRPDGATRLDKQKMLRQLGFWCALAIGVCATQIIFIAAQTKDDGIGTTGVWIFAILRAIFTLVADGYTAFAHEEKPTTAERALEEEQQRTKHTKEFLHQKRQEITIINDGILEVREAHTEAEIKDDKLQTRLKVEKLQNKAQVETLETQADQARMFTRLGQSMMRAIFDPEMPEEQRQVLLGNMQGFISAMKQLPQPGQNQTTVIEEEEDV